jgi:hypothetical protein
VAVDNPRILELQRRVDADPASIAFAQLAEEHRRSGYYEEAVQCCRTGLARHPGYLSARVTLGRALIELGSLEEAEGEFDLVLSSAPDNLAAIRGMAEIHQRRGNLALALEFYRRALPLARHDPELEEAITKIDRELATVRPASGPTGLSFLDELELFSAAPAPPSAPAAPSTSPAESSESLPRVAESDLGAAEPPVASAISADQPPAARTEATTTLAKGEPPPASAPESDAESDQTPPTVDTSAEQPPPERIDPVTFAPPEPAIAPPKVADPPHEAMAVPPEAAANAEDAVAPDPEPDAVVWTMPDTLDVNVDAALLMEAPDNGLADPDAPVDFDAVLRSLGVPDAEPPAIMDMLLAAPPTAERDRPVLSELPDVASDASNDPFAALDPFASLERELRALEFPRAEVSAPPARDGTEVPPSVRPTAVVILTELEAWLTAIQERRDDRPESV